MPAGGGARAAGGGAAQGHRDEQPGEARDGEAGGSADADDAIVLAVDHGPKLQAFLLHSPKLGGRVVVTFAGPKLEADDTIVRGVRFCRRRGERAKRIERREIVHRRFGLPHANARTLIDQPQFEEHVEPLREG